MPFLFRLQASPSVSRWLMHPQPSQGIDDFPHLFWSYGWKRTSVLMTVRKVVLSWLVADGFFSLFLAQCSNVGSWPTFTAGWGSSWLCAMVVTHHSREPGGGGEELCSEMERALAVGSRSLTLSYQSGDLGFPIFK